MKLGLHMEPQEYINLYPCNQGCRVGVGVGVARSRGNEPGVGVRVGVDQMASTPTPEHFFLVYDIIYLCRGKFT